MMMFEYGIPTVGDLAMVNGEWKTISSYTGATVYFTDGTLAPTFEVTEVRLIDGNRHLHK